ncbi:MAG: hypothetical protein J6B70_00945, partial [Oscillospiraceae bacterium]|nr:hypothetical protein [Oscillospiraceae bacterium]
TEKPACQEKTALFSTDFPGICHPPGGFRHRSSDSLHMIPPAAPFVKCFLTKNDRYFYSV